MRIVDRIKIHGTPFVAKHPTMVISIGLSKVIDVHILTYSA